MHKEIQNYLRFAACDGRVSRQIGPLLTTITSTWDNPYVNYAIPDDDGDPTDDEVREFVAYYRSQGRVPRLEYIPELAPRVRPALLGHGFVEEGVHPLMVATPSADPVICPDGFAFFEVRSREEAAALVAAQFEAYGHEPPRDADVDRTARSVTSGSFAVSVVEVSSGRCAGGGNCTRPRDGVTEVAGIGVRSVFRKKGLGEAVTRELLRQCAERGVTHPFLMAASEIEARMYRRAGFRDAGTVLCLRRD